MWWVEASPFEFEGNVMETKKITWSEFSKEEKSTVKQILASEEGIYKNKYISRWVDPENLI